MSPSGCPVWLALGKCWYHGPLSIWLQDRLSGSPKDKTMNLRESMEPGDSSPLRAESRSAGRASDMPVGATQNGHKERCWLRACPTSGFIMPDSDQPTIAPHLPSLSFRARSIGADAR